MPLHKLKIKTDGVISECLLDGQPIRTTSIAISMKGGDVAQAVLELYANVEYEGPTEIKLNVKDPFKEDG